MTDRTSKKLSKLSLICALLVVVLHVGIGPKWIGKVLAIKAIAVPTFFVVAGYLFAGRMGEPGWWGRQLKSRVRSLVIPYVFWNVAYWCFLAGLSVTLGLVGVKYGGLELINGLMGANWDVLGLMPFSFSALGLLWFVRCLIFITVISPLFLVFSRKWGGAIIMVGYFALAIWSAKHPDPEAAWARPWLIRGWLQSAIFFGAGVWIRFNGGEDLHISRGVGFLLLVVGYGCLAKSGYWSMIGLPLAMTGLWYSLSERELPKMLTGCSFPVYVLHAFMGVGASAVFAVVGLKEWADSSVLAWIVKWIIMSIGAILMTIALRKAVPTLARFVFGGR